MTVDHEIVSLVVVGDERELGHRVESRPTDHRFVGVSDGVAATVGAFLVDSV